MRQDMHKLIKVLPSRGGGWAKIKSPRDLEQAPLHEPMLPRVGGWNLKENHDWTTPVDRYLLAQVGRPWNDVFSDICAHNDNRSKTQYDVRDYIRYAVHTKIVIIDGKPFDSEGHMIWRRLWVHPDTGILMAIPVEKKYRWGGWRTKFDQVPIDADHKYVRINGLWFLVTFAPFTRQAFEARIQTTFQRGVPGGYDNVFRSMIALKYLPRISDVVFGKSLRRNYDDAVTQLSREWGSAIYAVNKRQIGSREIKKVASQWAALELAREAV